MLRNQESMSTSFSFLEEWKGEREERREKCRVKKRDEEKETEMESQKGGKREEKASCSLTSGENSAHANDQKLMGKTPQRAEM